MAGDVFLLSDPDKYKINTVTVTALIRHYFARIKIATSSARIAVCHEQNQDNDPKRKTPHIFSMYLPLFRNRHDTSGALEGFLTFPTSRAARLKGRPRVRCALERRVAVGSESRSRCDPGSRHFCRIACVRWCLCGAAALPLESLLPWIVSTVYIMPVTSVPLSRLSSVLLLRRCDAI